jgi:hypothetical protein
MFFKKSENVFESSSLKNLSSQLADSGQCSDHFSSTGEDFEKLSFTFLIYHLIVEMTRERLIQLVCRKVLD